jgi:signal transduction histidine kinase
MVDREGSVRLWNQAAESITGLRAESVLGRPIGAAVAGWERIALEIPVGEATGRTTPATLPLDTLARGEVWLSLYGIAFDGGTVYAFRVVTGQRELESLRSDVIATFSHVLRTPIAAVYGAAQTLRGRSLDPSMTDSLLEMIDLESVRLANLVDEILLTSQIDNDQLQLDRARVDPHAPIDSITRATPEPGLVVDVPDRIAAACGDAEKVRQVLANFVENALKYSGRPPTVRVREVRDAVRFEVSDAGPGIPRPEQQRIFEKFYRLDPHMKEGVRGTGLGLYICRELVHRMQGRIGVDSVEGRGSTFWFELPRY